LNDKPEPEPYTTEWFCQRTLAEEANGKAVVMRDPKVRLIPPRRPAGRARPIQKWWKKFFGDRA
jgi:hypothetical protein